MRQRTLKNVVRATGVGVHTGKKVFITLRPAAPNTGIIFRRIDLDQPVEIPAKVEFIGNTNLATSLARNDVKVVTVEHLLSALSGLCIDNVYIDLTSEEVPIMDGSSAPFVFLIQSAGVEEQSEAKKFIRITRKISIKEGDKWLKLEPYDGFKMDFSIEYNHPAFVESNQKATFDFSTTSYVREISRARTYGFLADYEYIRKNNLAIGASLDNSVVLDEFKVINQDGLRYPDECVRHKILDAMGDLYLLGHTVLGLYSGHKSGHSLNRQLLQKVLQEENSWEVITFADKSQVPSNFFAPYAEEATGWTPRHPGQSCLGGPECNGPAPFISPHLSSRAKRGISN